MPGRLFLTRVPEMAAWLGVACPDEPERSNIAPGQEVLCLTELGLGRARWGMIPVGRVNARGRPVMETIVNARSETVFDKSAFAGVSRAVVPCDGWYEWTGARGRRVPWRIARADGQPVAFAAIRDVWAAPGGREVAQVATVTCPPNADVAAIHDRMGVILERSAVEVWLSGSAEDAAALMQPAPAGTLTVEKAEGVDWAGP
ncbi:SOS response-associated peptidase [Flavimaricola marinus]|uniref:Abasic site processing protein n=1 Tax=Flavimaricola marinus TaxID=1819565 RepID=A0A238LIK8_9RHOB|nr:SOS response-associated peptidase [Flavimaricola marinus]SMY08796.1 Putative SOS response-associated peptidase YedK [Flavimaricola marinus]